MTECLESVLCWLVWAWLRVLVWILRILRRREEPGPWLPGAQSWEMQPGLHNEPGRPLVDPARPLVFRQPQPPSPDVRTGVSLAPHPFPDMSWMQWCCNDWEWASLWFSAFNGFDPMTTLMKIKICIANNPIPEQTSQTRNKQLKKSIMFQTSDLIPSSLTPCHNHFYNWSHRFESNHKHWVGLLIFVRYTYLDMYIALFESSWLYEFSFIKS